MSSDVKWIKLSTQMFEDEKIRLIESMPEADTILIIWVKLLAQAGKTNNGGKIRIEKDMTRPFWTALKTFKQLGLATYEIIDAPIVEIQITEFGKWVTLDHSCVVNEGDWKALRLFVLERDKFTCKYCGDKEGPFEADHVLPRSKGGLDTEDNLVCACRSCNRSKKDKTPEEWSALHG